MPPVKSSKVLVVDDEPEYLGWVKEFLETQHLTVVFARTLDEAFGLLHRDEFKLLLVDMNVPPGSSIEPAMKARVPLVAKYPGLAFAVSARDLGYSAPAVVAYTVHDDDAVDRELAKVNCRYVLKGRPQVLKSVIAAALKARSLTDTKGR